MLPLRPQVQEEKLALGLLSPFEVLTPNRAPSSLLISGFYRKENCGPLSHP